MVAAVRNGRPRGRDACSPGGPSPSSLIDTPLDVRQGHLHVPEKPGLGLEMNLDYLRAHAVDGWGG